MRISGLSLVMGSWKIKPSSGPRNERKSRFRMVTRSRSRNLTSPVTFAASGSRPSTPLPTVDLPLPDPPTSPNVSPLRGFGRLYAVPEEAQPRQRQQRIRRIESGDDRDVLHHVAEDVARDDGARLRAQHARGLDVRLFPHTDDAVSDDAEVLRDVDDSDGQGSGHDAA